MEDRKRPVDRHKVKRHPESTSPKVCSGMSSTRGASSLPQAGFHHGIFTFECKSAVEPTPPTTPLASKGVTALGPGFTWPRRPKLLPRGICPRGSNSLEALEFLETAS
ncbi:hypothetical protein PGT21_022298 [Puccinia graminis f. sp. tritici]|uniref:Uncharacterized protein n=1 Tax=Puccinia graminis f. sp. tritici TaxID=56615 RepID=A0A5B0N180_PUCGR|nr:hypothetical protein PGT21_022298 [Puccinia graminis f. sp. tritici]KAA1124074.1 hypothetical protein PGTUg99_025633 [Puccinia graminis f. sp. tritici]